MDSAWKDASLYMGLLWPMVHQQACLFHENILFVTKSLPLNPHVWGEAFFFVWLAS